MARQKDHCMGFKSLWLRFGVRAYGQGLGTDLRFADSGFTVKV